MSTPEQLDGPTGDLFTGPLARLVDDLLIGVAILGDDGVLGWANASARQLVDGPGGKELLGALAEMCGRAGDGEGPVEAVVSLGPVGEVRALVSRGEAGVYAFLERSALARLRAESRILRAMLSAATEALPPREAASRALGTLAGALAGSHVVLYEIDGSGTMLAYAAEAGLAPPQVRVPATLKLGASASSVSRAAVTGAPVFLSSLARSPFAAEVPAGGGEELAVLALPVRSRGQVIGALSVCRPAGILGEGEIRLVQGLADAVGSLLERARQDAAITADREARKSLMDNLPDALVEQGADGRISVAGGRLVPILGRTEDELRGLRIEELLVEADRARFAAWIAAAPGEAQMSSEFTVLQPSGKTLVCDVSLHASRWGLAAILRAVFRDVSGRKALEEDVRRAREIAAQRERLAAIGQLAAGVAHEINNPLSFVKSNLHTFNGWVEDLEARFGPEIAAATDPADPLAMLGDVREMLRESLSGIDRIVAIVQALKGMARNRPNERLRMDPVRAIKDAVTIFRGAKRAECQVDLEVAGLPFVVGAPGALSQVLLNLMENGLDAMGGKGRLVVRAMPEGPGVRIEVEDHGPGIPPEIEGRVFEPFFTTKEVGKGTGLGLFICHEIVEQMGGAIDFDTGPGGTVFRIDLPAAD